MWYMHSHILISWEILPSPYKFLLHPTNTLPDWQFDNVFVGCDILEI